MWATEHSNVISECEGPASLEATARFVVKPFEYNAGNSRTCVSAFPDAVLLINPREASSKTH